MVTTSSLAGTFLSGQLAGSDQRVCLDGDPAVCACTTANALTSRNTGRSDARRNERWCVLTNKPSVLEDDREPQRQRRAIRRPVNLEREENSRLPTIPG